MLTALGLLVAPLVGALSPASAHSPHDVTPFVSASPDGVVLTGVNETLVYSADRGRTVGWVTVPFGGVQCAVAWSATRWVVAGRDGGTWRTDDDGRSWSTVVGPVGVTRCLRTPTGAVLVDGGGLWESDDGAAWAQLGGPFRLEVIDVAQAADGAWWALDRTGQAWVLPAGSDVWEVADTGPWAAVAASDEQLVLASLDGGLWVESGGSVTALPGSPEGMIRLAWGDGVWLAVGADEAVWISEDDGASWRLEAEGLDPLAEGLSGGATDGMHYFDLAAAGGAWHLASFEGAYSSDAGETRWHQWPILALPLVTDIAWLGEREVLTTTTGGGVYRGVPGADEWGDVSAGIGWPWLRQVVVSPGNDDWFVGGGNTLYISRDEGATWQASATGLPIGGYGVGIHPDYPADQLVLFGGQDADEHAAISRSEDGGETWASTLLPTVCVLKPSRVTITRERAWTACGGTLYRSEDRGVTWVEHAAIGVTTGSQIVPTPDGAIYVGTDQGLARIDGAGEPVIVAAAGQVVEALARGGDDTLYLGIAAGGIVRIDPDGSEFTTAWPATTPVWALAVSPEGRLGIGTHDGLFLSEDGGVTYALANAWDRYDDAVQAWWFDAGWEIAIVSAAKAGEVYVGRAGAVAEWEGRMATFALVGSANEAWVRVTIDGVGQLVYLDDPLPVNRLWDGRADPGWHRVRVEVVSGELVLDGGEAWREPYRLDQEGGPIESDNCGCASGRAAPGLGVVLLGLVALARRRR